MLNQIKLINFKSWQRLDISLSPLTLLFGTNSSGKTSVLQALLLLKQTVENFDRRQHISFGGGERDLVNLGGFRELVFNHVETDEIGITLEWTSFDSLDGIVPRFDLSNDEQFNFAYGVFWRYLDDNVVIQQLNYSILPPIKTRRFLHVSRDEFGQYEFETEATEEGKRGSDPIISSPLSCYLLPEEINGKPKYDPFEFSRRFEALMGRIFYLGPLRNHPERESRWTGAAPQTVGPRGENCIHMLIASERREAKNGESLLQNVAYWLRQLQLVSEFRVEAIDPDKKFYKTQVKVEPNGIESSLIDVGFGVSQVLPVIVLLFSAPEGSIILIEQPELHLHPCAQSNLADLFLHVAQQRNLQLIIESHSEHLLTRLQRRIAESNYQIATPEKIRLYFCQPGIDGSTSQTVKVDEYGQISNWPENFFGDTAGDLDAMMEAGFAKRRQEMEGG